MLREYRKIRDVDWEPEVGKTGMTRKERAKKLMDQKANSIADLSAVLQVHGARAKELVEAREVRGRVLEELKEEETRAREGMAVEKWSILERRAQQAEGGSIERFDAHIRALVAKKSGASEEEKKSIKNLMSKLRRRRDMLKKAQEAVTARSTAEPSGDTQNVVNVVRSTVLDAIVRQARTTRNGRTPLPVAWPKNFRKIRHKLEAMPEVPQISLEGVKIQWADIQDAEYAESWPEPVVHELFGLARYTAPDPKKPPTTWQSLNEEAEKHMEENVQLDGEASEEGGEDEQVHEDFKEPTQVREEDPGERSGEEQARKQSQAAASEQPSRKPLSRLRSLFMGRQAAQSSDRSQV